ncbi:MAG: hypothetical protein IJ635_01420 [Bacteroidaceae bacterium]|nr:hypothetical protein [Bacteroidaceae bacterium]
MQYKFRELPDLNGEGKRKIYPHADHYPVIDTDALTREIAEQMGFNSGMTKGVIDALVNRITHYIEVGHSVKVDGLGVFYVSLGMKDGVKAEELKTDGSRYNTNDVTIKKVTFSADRNWMRQLRRTIELEKVGEVAEIAEVKSTVEERLAALKAYLKEHAYIRVATYAELTGQSHSVAGAELRRFSQDASTGIGFEGTRSTKVYILR